MWSEEEKKMSRKDVYMDPARDNTRWYTSIHHGSSLSA
jgi:hypothetical protein